MKIFYNFLVVVVLLFFSVNTRGTSIQVAGEVSGTWNYDTVRVTGDITIPYGKILTISPGCMVLFDGYFKLDILGQLISKGTSQNSIRFERSDTTGYAEVFGANGAWKGITMGSPAWAPSQFEHCVFKYTKGGRAFNLMYGTSQFKYCKFEDNKSDPLIYINSSGNRISNTIFSDNLSPRVVEVEGALYDTVYFDNNTIVNNRGLGLNITGYVNSAFIMTNTILWNNYLEKPDENQIYYSRYDSHGFDTSAIILRNCIIQNGGKLSFYNNSCFDKEPKFVNPEDRDYSPSWKNFPIDDDTKSISIDNGLYLSAPDDDGSRRDIGAISFFEAGRKNSNYSVPKNSLNV